MKKLITIILLTLSSIAVQSQQCRSYMGDDMSISFYTSLDYSKGFEFRGEFDNFYMAFQVESFVFDEEDHLNWGGSLGFLKNYENYSLLGGIRGGFVSLKGGMRPSFGLEAEADLNLFNNIFVGVRVTYDLYMNSTLEEVNSSNYSRVFLKLGYKF